MLSMGPPCCWALAPCSPLPPSSPPVSRTQELQQQLLYLVRESEAKDLKEGLRTMLMWQAQAVQAMQQAQGVR